VFALKCFSPANITSRTLIASPQSEILHSIYVVCYLLVWMSSKYSNQFNSMDPCDLSSIFPGLQGINLLLQRLHCLPNNLLPKTNSFHSCFLYLFQCTNGPNMWLRRSSRSKLPCSYDREATFRVVSWSWVMTCACREDCRLAC